MSLASKFGNSFYQSALLDTRSIIDMGLWSGVERHRFDNWCQQFTGEGEKVILALLLRQLVYRSKEQVRALLYQAFDRGIPQKLFEITGDENVFEEMKLYQSHRNYPRSILIVPVIRDFEPPTKSGPLVARLFKKMININDRMMKWPWQLDEIDNLKTIIFVDDFVGTGEQFLKFCDHHIDQSIFEKDLTFLYAPITANSEGLDNITKTKPFINVSPIELVTPENNFFTASQNEHSLSSCEVQELEGYYNRLLTRVGLDNIGQRKGKMTKGYGGLALTYAYEHGTPNGSLPLLWANSDNYTSLFSR